MAKIETPVIKIVNNSPNAVPMEAPLIASNSINSTGIINTLPKMSEYKLSRPVVESLVANKVNY